MLPLCPLIVAIQMYVATFAKSFKEAQSYLSFLMMVQMVPGMMATMNTMSTKAWMYYVPWIGQQTLLTDVLGNKPISPVVFVIVGVINVTLAVVVLHGTSGLLHREKIIFGEIGQQANGLDGPTNSRSPVRLLAYFTFTTICADVQQH